MDAGALASILRRPALAAELVGVERITLSVKLAIAVVAAQGGRDDLVRELQSLAGGVSSVRLVQAPGSPARLEAGSLRLPVSASLRDALRVAAGARQSPAAVAPSVASSTGAVTPASLPASSAFPLTAALATAGEAARPSTAAASTAAAVAPSAVAAFTAAALRTAAQWPEPALDRRATVTTPVRAALAGSASWRTPLHGDALLDETLDTRAAAMRLQRDVRESALFLEARLARALAGEQNSATGSAGLHEAARPAAQLMQPERTSAQIEMLRRDAAAVTLTAWAGQTAWLDVGREPVEAGSATGTPEGGRVFFATLSLELPRLGKVTARLRLVNCTLAASVEAAQPMACEEALPELAAQLHARGLNAAGLRVSHLEPEK